MLFIQCHILKAWKGLLSKGIPQPVYVTQALLVTPQRGNMPEHTDLFVCSNPCYQEELCLANLTPLSSAELAQQQDLTQKPVHPLLCTHHSQALLGEVVVDVGGLHSQVPG